MIYFDKGKILGWNSPSIKELTLLSAISMENQFDKYGRPNWIWPDYPEGKPIYSPQPYTAEQTEQLRKEWCKTEIRKQYSIEDELKLLRKSIKNEGKVSDNFAAYDEDIEKIITESNIKDYQIECIIEESKDIKK